MIHARTILALTGSLAISACVLGPDPSQPTAELPASVRGDSAPLGVSFGDNAWPKVFTDPALRELISRALKYNPDLIAATYRIEAARAQAELANSNGFPQLGGSADASAKRTSGNTSTLGSESGHTSESYRLNALLSWEVDLWGGIRRNNQAARAQLLASESQRDAVRTSLIAAVASAYIELQNLDERLGISEHTRESRQGSLQLVIARRDGGVSSDLEVGQAQVLLSQAEITIPATEKSIAAKENEIRALLGELPSSLQRRAGLTELSASLHIAAGLPSALLERRPDVTAASLAFQAATARIGVAEALRFPSLSLTGQGGFISSDLTHLFEQGSTAYSVGPQLTGSLFDAGAASARVRGANANAKEALAHYRATTVRAFREAADALNACQKFAEIITEQSRLVDSQKSVSMLARDRFQAGASSYLEVLDAERGLFAAELDLADAQRNRLLAIVQAYRALGGGWK